MSVIDLVNHRVTGTINVGSGPDGIVLTPGCGVNVPRFGQCQINKSPDHWGHEQYAFHNGVSMCGKGCVTTALSMNLISEGVFELPLCKGFLSCFSLPHVPNDPGTLNDFMTRLLSIGDYTVPTGPDSGNDVNLPVTTLDVGRQLGFLPIRFQGFNRGIFSDASQRPVPSDAAHRILDRTLCSGHPVIVRVTGSDGQRGTHKVLVTGKQGLDYRINDPAGTAPGSAGNSPPCPNAPQTLKPCTTLSQYGWFEIMGFVTDPPLEMSNLNVAVDTNADLLLVDSLARRTGFGGAAGGDLTEIPEAVHFVDETDDEETSTPPTTTIHWVDLFHPPVGAYRVIVTGLQVGVYALTINAASTDGTAQPVISVQGIAGNGSTSVFQVQFSPAPGSTLVVARMATVQSTVADINNGLQLGLIDNPGLANSLAQKVQNAADATGAARTNILNAFTKEVSAQSGKHITGVAVMVLLEDANSLINHTAP